MDRAQARFPHLSPDPKRIAATSVAISVHVLVLMLLLLPGQTPPSKVLEDPPLTMIVPVKIDPLPPVVPLTPPRPVTPIVRQQPTPPQADPVDNTVSPIDNYVAPVADDAVIDTFEINPPPAFVQISADVAPAPPYPLQALRRGLTGEVVLRVRVDVQGRPVSAVVETSSGSKLLDNAALKFVLARWHFIPATQNGAPIEAQALVPINFVIER